MYLLLYSEIDVILNKAETPEYGLFFPVFSSVTLECSLDYSLGTLNCPSQFHHFVIRVLVEYSIRKSKIWIRKRKLWS